LNRQAIVQGGKPGPSL